MTASDLRLRLRRSREDARRQRQRLGIVRMVAAVTWRGRDTLVSELRAILRTDGEATEQGCRAATE